jgi:hypothetical protein
LSAEQLGAVSKSLLSNASDFELTLSPVYSGHEGSGSNLSLSLV